MKRRNYYSGARCKSCNKEITTGSKLGFCILHSPRAKLKEEHKNILKSRMTGNKIWLGRKHSDNSKKKMSENNGRWNKGKKMSLEYRKKLSISKSGKKHWNWQGGITDINKSIRTSFEYKLWREAVFERDNYTCIWCGVRSGMNSKVTINADHIKPFSLYPELRFAIDNGRTLCHDCHRKTDTFGGKIKKARSART